MYLVDMPPEVQALLMQISFTLDFSIDIGFEGIGVPMQCLGLESYLNKLAFMMAWPVLLIAGIIAGFFLWNIVVQMRAKRKINAKLACKEAGFQSLPVCLVILFLVFPAVSTVAFEGLDVCEEFSSREPEFLINNQFTQDISFLKADPQVVCDTPQHTQIQALALVAVLLYPLGIPAFFFVMLRIVRKELKAQRSSRLSEALGFLHRDYESDFYYWESAPNMRGSNSNL